MVLDLMTASKSNADDPYAFNCIRRSDNKAGGGEWRAARFHSAQMIIC